MLTCEVEGTTVISWNSTAFDGGQRVLSPSSFGIGVERGDGSGEFGGLCK